MDVDVELATCDTGESSPSQNPSGSYFQHNIDLAGAKPNQHEQSTNSQVVVHLLLVKLAGRPIITM